MTLYNTTYDSNYCDTRKLCQTKTSKYGILAFFLRKEFCFALRWKFNYLQLLYNSGVLLLIAVDFLREKLKIFDLSNGDLRIREFIIIQRQKVRYEQLLSF